MNNHIRLVRFCMSPEFVMWVVWFCSLMRIGNRSFLYEWGLEGVVSVWSGGVLSAKSELIAIRIFAVNLIAAFVVYVHGFLYIFPLLQLFIWLSLV